MKKGEAQELWQIMGNMKQNDGGETGCQDGNRPDKADEVIGHIQAHQGVVVQAGFCAHGAAKAHRVCLDEILVHGVEQDGRRRFRRMAGCQSPFLFQNRSQTAGGFQSGSFPVLEVHQPPAKSLHPFAEGVPFPVNEAVGSVGHRLSAPLPQLLGAGAALGIEHGGVVGLHFGDGKTSVRRGAVGAGHGLVAEEGRSELGEEFGVEGDAVLVHLPGHAPVVGRPVIVVAHGDTGVDVVGQNLVCAVRRLDGPAHLPQDHADVGLVELLVVYEGHDAAPHPLSKAHLLPTAVGPIPTGVQRVQCAVLVLRPAPEALQRMLVKACIHAFCTEG